MTTKDKARDGEFTLPPSRWLLKRQQPTPTEEIKSQEAGATLRDTGLFRNKKKAQLVDMNEFEADPATTVHDAVGPSEFASSSAEVRFTLLEQYARGEL